MRKTSRRLGIAALVLAGALAGCSMLPEPTVEAILSNGSCSYPIQIRNLVVQNLGDPEGRGVWINAGEDRCSFTVSSGVSYIFQAVGFDVGAFNEQGLTLIRHYSNEYRLCLVRGERATLYFNMPETN